jgi:hypothetical protein
MNFETASRNLSNLENGTDGVSPIAAWVAVTKPFLLKATQRGWVTGGEGGLIFVRIAPEFSFYPVTASFLSVNSRLRL